MNGIIAAFAAGIYYGVGVGVVFNVMWENRPNGWWWLFLPGWAAIWPIVWLDTR